jgi:hypothetical protein
MVAYPLVHVPELPLFSGASAGLCRQKSIRVDAQWQIPMDEPNFARINECLPDFGVCLAVEFGAKWAFEIRELDNGHRRSVNAL